MRMRITGGTLRGRSLIGTTKTAVLRPTSERVRGAIFSILGPHAVEEARVVDLYAGTGALGIEALSRGAAWVDFVEASSRLGWQIGENLSRLLLDTRGRVYRVRVERALDVLPSGYDLAFADPPYSMDDWTWLMGRMGGGALMKERGIVVVEHRYGASLLPRYGQLARLTSRRYGDTAISMYEVGDVDA